MKKLSISLFMLTLSASSSLMASSIAVVPTTNQVYSFSGTCAVNDCTGSGTGVLTLAPSYTLGSAITTSNFVSFTYSSNLLPSVSYYSGDPNLNVSGSLPSNLPGPGTVRFSEPNYYTFNSSTNGSWSVLYNGVLSDQGSNGSFSTASAPEPASIALLGMGLAGLALASRRKK